MRAFSAISFLLMFSASCLIAETLHVPHQFETIQGAIDEAGNRDTVIVAPGEYEENIDFDGKNIVIVGNPDDPSETVIDGGENASVVQFTNRESSSAILDGFTLRNGRAEGNGGGGIYCENASPTLRNLVITGCFGNRGGGILCWTANPSITDVIIEGNTSQAQGGGISLMDSASPTMRNLVIRGNRSSSNNGGGIDNRSRGRPQIFNSIVRGNTAVQRGGGIYSSSEFLNMASVIVDSNSAGSEGGGIFGNGHLQMAIVTVAYNSGEDGGGIYLNAPRPAMEKMTIVGNRSAGRGGGLFLTGAVADLCDPNLIRTTIAYNTAEGGGGGLFCTANANPTLNTCIVWGNGDDGIVFDADDRACSITVSYSDVELGEDGIHTNDNGEIDWGEGNVDGDPLFAGPDGGDFGLTWENYPEDDETKSPCIDAGRPDLADDPDGTRADMGSRYFHQNTPEIVVDPDSYDFGAIIAGQSDTTAINVSNVGDAPLQVEETVLVPDGDPFRIIEGGGQHQVEPGGNYAISIEFAPQEAGFFRTILTLHTNDPLNRQLSVSIVGTGGNSPPVVNSPVPDYYIIEDSSWAIIGGQDTIRADENGWFPVGDMDTIFTDPDGDRVNYQVPRWPEQVEVDILHGSVVYFNPVPNFWIDSLEFVMRAIDPWQNMASDTFYIEFVQLNDPPESFALLSPSDGQTIGGWEASFIWGEAAQNQWEIDTVRYELHFTTEESDDEYVITDIALNQYEDLDMQEFAQALGFELGQGDIEVEWSVTALDDSASTVCDAPFNFVIPPNSVPGTRENSIPGDYVLSPNYPNPFNPTTTIRFGLPRSSRVRLIIAGSDGRTLTSLARGSYDAGFHEVTWNAGARPAGIYFVHFQAGRFKQVRKMLLIR